MADSYRQLYPRGTAVVTQFQARPQLLVRMEKTHRPTALSYAEAVFSPLIPAPTKESIQWVVLRLGCLCFPFLRSLAHFHYFCCNYLFLFLGKLIESLARSTTFMEGCIQSSMFCLMTKWAQCQDLPPEVSLTGSSAWTWTQRSLRSMLLARLIRQASSPPLVPPHQDLLAARGSPIANQMSKASWGLDPDQIFNCQ